MVRTRSAERTVIVGYVLSLLGMLVLAFAAYEIPQQLVRSAREVAAAARVLGTISDIGRSALDAESTARAYIVTGEAQILKRYLRLLPEIDQNIAAFRRMTERDVGQQARASRVEAQIKDRFEYLTSVLRARETQGFEAAQRMAAQGRGRAGMNVIRATLASMETEINRAAEARRAEEESITRLLNALVAAMVVVGALILAWITHQTRRALRLLRESEERVRHLAHHDALTGLPNRRLLNDRLARMIASAKRSDGHFAVLFLDLDGFKAVNDTLGHDAGDELLRQASARLQRIGRAEDTLARLGGDEFVMALRVVSAAQDAAVVAQKVLDTLALPFTVSATQVRISASIGIAIYPEDAGAPEPLITAADDALYLAKRAGRNRFEFSGSAGKG